MFFAKRHKDVLAASLLWATFYCKERFQTLLIVKSRSIPSNTLRIL